MYPDGRGFLGQILLGKKKKSDRGLACGISIVNFFLTKVGRPLVWWYSAGVNQQSGGTFALDTGASAAKALQRRSGRLTIRQLSSFLLSKVRKQQSISDAGVSKGPKIP